MFAGFNLKIDKSFFESQEKTLEEYQKIGVDHLASQGKGIKKTLENYSNKNVINGSEIQNDWFPEVQVDIFLSHSSGDKELVNAIAGWMNDTFNLKCFVDSNVWNYAGDICEMLNEKYSNKRLDGKGGYLYNHARCLKVSEHVNTMLNIALQKMIDKCESVFLINTENSIHINEDSEHIDLTYSPWIYSELASSEIVRKKPLSLYRYNTNIYHSRYESYCSENQKNELTISYNAPTEHLIKINQGILQEWQEKFSGQYPFPLDILYMKYFENIVSETKEYFKY